MKRSLLCVVGFLAAAISLGAAPAALAFEATDGTVEIIQPTPPAATEIVCCGTGIGLVFAPFPVPPAPTLILEGTVFNRLSGRPVEGALIYRAFPTGHHAGVGPVATLAASEVAPSHYVIDPGSIVLRPVVFTVGSDENGLYSTTADATQYSGVMAYCVYQRRNGDDKLVTSTATLPGNTYTPYLRRDMYLNLPAYVSKCDPQLTYELFLAEQGL